MFRMFRKILLMIISSLALFTIESAISFAQSDFVLPLSMKSTVSLVNPLPSLSDSTSASLTYGNVTYFLPLTKSNLFLSALFGNSIVWTVIRPNASHSLQTQSVYETPLLKTNLHLTNHNIDLWANSHLITTFSVGQNKNNETYEVPVCYADGSHFYVTQTLLAADHKQKAKLYSLSHDGTLSLLTHFSLGQKQSFNLYDDTSSLTILISRSTLLGTVVRAIHLDLLSLKQSTIDPIITQPIVYTEDGHNVYVLGSSIYRDQTDGSWLSSPLAPDHSLLHSLSTMTPPTSKISVLPSRWVSYFNIYQFHIPSNSTTTFQLVPLHAQTNLTNVPLIFHSLTSPPSLAPNDQSLHQFNLASAEGPIVTWQLDTAKQDHNWYAFFSMKGWGYRIGPFTSPVDANHAPILSALLTVSADTTPVPSSPKGLCKITLTQDGNFLVQKTTIDYEPNNSSWVEAQSPNLALFHWINWIANN